MLATRLDLLTSSKMWSLLMVISAMGETKRSDAISCNQRKTFFSLVLTDLKYSTEAISLKLTLGGGARTARSIRELLF